MDSWYNSKFDDLNNKSTKHVDRIRGAREEIANAKKDVKDYLSANLKRIKIFISKERYEVITVP